MLFLMLTEVQHVSLRVQDEKEEWRRFQADLQTAVVVANDIKVEAQQELRAVRRQLQEEQDRSAKLSADLEALQGVRYHLPPCFWGFFCPRLLLLPSFTLRIWDVFPGYGHVPE